MDPEASGPDTHYKVLIGVAGALKLYMQKYPEKKITVWGYRNVWYRFHPAHTNIYVPASMNSLAILSSAFNNCFGSQKEASFPSYEYDGPFSDLAQKIMAQQYDMIKTSLGADYFYDNASPRLRATHGFCFLKAMTTDEFFAQTQALMELVEVGK
jgi:glucosamine-6-phosphate deaminase